ncbi:MAG: CPBP family intramembrane metalloprotease [Rhodobacteraceae bacterium]|nr:CPBP family intramembrane metalloprotease [Paracoccaceae bacterium]
MERSVSEETPDTIPVRAVLPFLILTFGITWGVAGFYILFPDQAVRMFGAISGSHPLYFLATWSPAISGLVVVFAHAGWTGVRALVLRVRLWRISKGWLGFILVVLPLVYAAGSLLKGGPVLAPLPPEGAGPLAALMVLMLFLGPVEEFGWRGVLQPLLQRRMAPLWAGALIGAIWGTWHLPAFFLSGTVYATWNFLPFFVGNVVVAILVTPIFNQTRGSLFWPMMFHWQLIIPFWPDAQPWDTWILGAVAAVVVWWNRDTMLNRAGAVTRVLDVG